MNPDVFRNLQSIGGGSLEFKIHIKPFQRKNFKLSLNKGNKAVSILITNFYAETMKLDN